MRVCEVVGSLTLAKSQAAIAGARLLLARPMTYDDLRNGRSGTVSELVIWDELGAGVGSIVGVSEGAEAAAPFHPTRKPVDAYCACILDRVYLD